MLENNVIKANNLSVYYDSYCVLNGLNFNVHDGGFIALVGKSGTGKTTLLNTLAGFLKYNGQLSITGDIGFCFQNNSLFYWMTVEENIGFGLMKKDKDTLVEELLDKIGLKHLKHKYPSELSGGQIQRVALARAMAKKPSILFLDEPFSSLDIFTRDLMIDWVLNFISEMKITVVMVTHYLDEALIFSDKIFILNDKKISHEIIIPFSKPRTQKIRFTEDFQNKKQELINLLN